MNWVKRMQITLSKGTILKSVSSISSRSIEVNVSRSYSFPDYAQPVAGTAEGCLGTGVISCLLKDRKDFMFHKAS